MSQLRIRSRRLRAGTAAITVALVAGVLALAGAAPASATEDVTADRLAGLDRFETAAAIAAAGFPDGSDTVVVASGRAFPDALAGASLGLPILLTEPTELPDATAEAIDDLGATDAIILGGTAAVSNGVQSELEGLGLGTTRLAGDDRYETAGAIAGSFDDADVASLDGKPTAIVATGRDFADALAGGPLATSATDGVFPVLLVNDGVPDASSDAIADLGIEQVVILGGTAAVPATVEIELEAETGNPAMRLAGTDRFGTAVDVAESAVADFGMDATEVLLANGRVFADALAGGPLGALRSAPILLTEAVQLSDPTESYLVDRSADIDTVTALGGTAAVSDSTLDAAEAAAETPPDTRQNETYAVSPQGETDAASGGSVTYTAQVGTDVVDIALMPCGFPQVTASGDTVFANANANTIADSGASGGSSPDTASTDARITSVGGTPDPTIDDYVDDAEGDDSGALEFVVTGPGGSSGEACVVPVVFADANSDDALNVTTANPGTATEDFGTGGAAVFSPAEATGGTFNVDVQRSNDDSDHFVGCRIVGGVVDSTTCATYFYDANDTFQLPDGSTSHSPTTFESLLTAGDDVKGTYEADPASSSTFNLYNDSAPEAPSPAPGAPDTTDGVTFTFFESSRATVDAYRLYRAAKTADTCPPFSLTSYTRVAEVPDPSPESQSPEPVEITDTTAQAGKTYCYSLASVDDGDVGPGTAPATVAVPPSSAPDPTITDASGDDLGDPGLTAADVHQLTFSEALDPATASSASYTVTGDPISAPFTVTCGDNAVCVLSSNAKVLRARLLEDTGFVVDPEYPLTIQSVSGMETEDGRGVTLTGSDDTIEGDTLDDTAAPSITSVSFGTPPGSCVANPATAGALAGFGQTCDVLKVTFGENITLDVADATHVEADELNAILGAKVGDTATPRTVTYGPDTQITASVSGATVTFTVLKTVATGIFNGDDVVGTDTPLVHDADLNAEAPNDGSVELP